MVNARPATAATRRRAAPTTPGHHRCVAALALFLLVPATAGSLLTGGCTRPGLSLSADPTQGPIHQSAAIAPQPAPPTTAGTALPLAGAVGSMILAIGGLIVVVLGFRLVRQLAAGTNNTQPKPPNT